MCVGWVLHPLGEDIFRSICKADNRCSQGELCTHGWHHMFAHLGCNGIYPFGAYIQGFAQSPSMYVCDFTRALNLCIQNIHDLYHYKNAFISNASLCFAIIWESIWMRWHLDVNDCVEHLVFEAHLSTSAWSHLNATCIDLVTHIRSFVTKSCSISTLWRWRMKLLVYYFNHPLPPPPMLCLWCWLGSCNPLHPCKTNVLGLLL